MMCYSQVKNDSLKQMLSSKTFTLIEDYSGDKMGYWHTFTFTVQGEKLLIHWKNPALLKNGKDLDVLLPISELENLEMLFTNCSEKIKSSKIKSTEHTLYNFKNEKIALVIDDKYTTECKEDFKAWKEMLLLEGKKQEKK